MDAIKSFIESLTIDWGDRLGVVFPILIAGLLALYLASLVLGYLRVSQVGIADETHTGKQAIALPRSADGGIQAPRGIPYCAVDGLQFPAGARFCTSCERDLSLDCANCDVTLRAADESCYRCGTRTASADVPLLT